MLALRRESFGQLPNSLSITPVLSGLRVLYFFGVSVDAVWSPFHIPFGIKKCRFLFVTVKKNCSRTLEFDGSCTQILLIKDPFRSSMKQINPAYRVSLVPSSLLSLQCSLVLINQPCHFCVPGSILEIGGNEATTSLDMRRILPKRTRWNRWTIDCAMKALP